MLPFHIKKRGDKMNDANIVSEVNSDTLEELQKPPVKTKSNDEKYTFLIYQTMVCIVMLILLLLFKTFGGRFFNYAREKYSVTFERSLSVGEVKETVENALDFSKKEDQTRDELTVVTSAPLNYSENIIDDEFGFEAAGVNVTNQLLWPAKGRISSLYGLRIDPFTKKNVANHKGIDIAVPSGTAVKASLDGKVHISRFDPTYGNYIVVIHSEGIKTLYAHLSERKVEEGDTVHQGDVIALSGNTGNSTGPHLHFEILMGGTTRVDPMLLLPNEQ